MRHLSAIAAAVLAGSVLPLAAATSSPATAASTPYSVRTLHFLVHTGPSGATPCDIVGDVYVPRGADARHRVPAILTTNGFGGSKDDQSGLAQSMASRGYAVLTYSGLGFGGSGCKITLDDPDYDGRAAQQLVSYLGGAGGIAFTDAKHTTPAPRLRVVKRDKRDHHGRRSTNDPRVGMVGVSYGGGIQFAAASVDPRIDTLVPIATWNDLSYSLGPNNTTQTTGVTSSTPGTTKLMWGAGLSASGVAAGVQGAPVDPSRVPGCPGFATWVCPALVTGASTGYFQSDTIANLRHASVATFARRITVPVLLMQGERDTLFNLDEAVATYQALRRQGTTVKMIWQSWGHSDSTPEPGEIDFAHLDPRSQYLSRRMIRWFDHYLGDRRGGTGPGFAYFRDWVDYRGIASPAYATARSFPVGNSRTWFLDSTDALSQGTTARPGSQSFVTPVAGAPTNLDDADVVGSYLSGANQLSGQRAPGTYAAWRTAPLATPLDVAGIPRARLRVAAPSAALSQAAGPAGDLVLFLEVVDVAPDGSTHRIDGEIAPVRIPDVTKPFDVTLPAIVHRFAAGHRVGLVVGGGSPNYRGNLVAVPVTISAGRDNTLSLPVVG